MSFTPNTRSILTAVLEEFPKVTHGAWACRRIAGTLTWSQHSWENAADIFPQNMAVGDQVAAFIRAEFTPHIKVVLWRVKDHFDHVHFDPWPTGIATPPCKGGGLLVKHRDGKVGRIFSDDITSTPAPPQPVPVPPIPPGDETMEFLIKVYKGQTMSFYRAMQSRTGGPTVGTPRGNADYWGSDYVPPPGFNKPTEQEWRDAIDDFVGASAQIGVFQ